MRNQNYADRDKYPWDKENVRLYLKTKRVKWGNRIWQKQGICNQCGDCCKMDYFLPESEWVRSYIGDEERLQKGNHLGAQCRKKAEKDGWFWCNKLEKKADGNYECAIWRDKGFKSLPIICQIEPVDPRNGEWKDKYPNCSLSFKDITNKYL